MAIKFPFYEKKDTKNKFLAFWILFEQGGVRVGHYPSSSIHPKIGLDYVKSSTKLALIYANSNTKIIYAKII